MPPLPLAVLIGTRPEAIKLAPVLLALRRNKRFRPILIITAQHRQMLEQVLRDFDLTPDVDLNVMRPKQSLGDLSSRLMLKIGSCLQEIKPAALLVQGDTTSAFCGALAAFYHQIPVGHIEAGLRSGNMYSPFPEEINRQMIGCLARWHFAPTSLAAQNLRKESIPKDTIYEVGNTVVDALRHIARRPDGDRAKQWIDLKKGRPLVLVTCHRRENLGEPMKSIARALQRLAHLHPNAQFLFPIHLNPKVRSAMEPLLKGIASIRMIDPLSYPDFLACLKRATLVLSDSGGIQEEATALGKPVLVLRQETERSEGVRSGALKLVGTDEEEIVKQGTRLLSNPAALADMSQASKVFGDGRAAVKIISILERSLLRPRLKIE